jgi:ATP-dependent protease ClpP protease subunit
MPLIELVAERRRKQPPPGMQPPENAADWFRIENSADEADTTDIFVFDSIGGWFGMYADEFIEQLNDVTTSKINLRLNSPGGSVFEGIAIANAIRSHPAHVTVSVDSLAASIASVIMLAGDRVIMQPQSQVMIHNASGAAYGDSTEMAKMAELLDRQSRNIAEAYAEHTGRPVDEFLELMAAETWFTAKEAVEMGLADEAVPMRTKKAASEEETPVAARMTGAWDLSMYRYAGREQAPEPKVTAVLNSTAPTVETVEDAPVETAPVDFAELIRSGEFADLVRDLIRQEIAATQDPPDQAPDVTDGGQVQPDDSPAVPDSPENASTPPPDEDEEEEDEEDPPAEEEPTDQADDWSSVVGLLVTPTSPGADDVFAQLKEGW